jgi:hypothetical protein
MFEVQVFLSGMCAGAVIMYFVLRRHPHLLK